MSPAVSVNEGKAVDAVFQLSLTAPFQLWDGGIHSALGEELAEGQSSKRYSEWGYFWLVIGHQWCSSGLNFRASAVQYIYQRSGYRS